MQITSAISAFTALNSLVAKTPSTTAAAAAKGAPAFTPSPGQGRGSASTAGSPPPPTASTLLLRPPGLGGSGAPSGPIASTLLMPPPGLRGSTTDPDPSADPSSPSGQPTAATLLLPLRSPTGSSGPSDPANGPIAATLLIAPPGGLHGGDGAAATALSSTYSPATARAVAYASEQADALLSDSSVSVTI